ncbi:MAG TPA: hypothetical protein VJ925_01955 [Longimicrobiales bacterium]|nr:hypothetical protein [Longimicrobiales bacterium]
MERHLTPEALARLVDEAATREEHAHLAECEDCVRRLGVLRDQTAALGRLPDVRPPRGDWAVLEARLASEGLVRPEPNLFQRMASTPGWMRAAAALVLFIGGIGVGTGLDRSGPAVATNAPRSSGDVSVASLESATAGTAEEAAALVRLKEREYRDALVQYAQLSEGEGTIPNPEARMASLDYAIVSLQAGLQEAPADPVLNGFLASMLAERDHTLRQISNTTEYF